MVIDRRTHRNTDSISHSENIYYSSKRTFYLSLAWRTKYIEISSYLICGKEFKLYFYIVFRHWTSLCRAQAFHMLFVIFSRILLCLKWPVNVIVFSVFEIMSFFPLKVLSTDAKLFGRRRLQFHILHAENLCCKLPKCLVNVTLFGLYFKH